MGLTLEVYLVILNFLISLLGSVFLLVSLGILRGKVVEVLHLRLFAAGKKFYNALALFMVGFLLLVVREALEVAMDLGYLTFDAEGLVLLILVIVVHILFVAFIYSTWTILRGGPDSHKSLVGIPQKSSARGLNQGGRGR